MTEENIVQKGKKDDDYIVFVGGKPFMSCNKI